MNYKRFFSGIAVAAILSGFSYFPASAQMEFQFQYGSLKNPFSGQSHATRILTFQHAGAWKLGSSFFFIDFLDDVERDGFNDKEFYGEWYPTLSLSRLFGTTMKAGPVQDVSVVVGLNFDGDANVLKTLPGLRLSWQIPGFIFVNTDFTAMIDHSNEPLRTTSGFMFDVSWLKVMNIGGQSFSFMGHAEYIGAVDQTDFGTKSEAWILAQPQFVWDLGNAFGSPNWIHIGVELQYWKNKLGVKDQNELRPEFLVVWRL
ncbi:MAG: nucleoside-binding protein [Rhodothermaceae bacterium]|nr:nucleoside-binding protein [Rhodothermaceae bacterium]